MLRENTDSAPALVADDPHTLDLIGDAAECLARAVEHHLPGKRKRNVLGSAQCEIFLKAKQLERLLNPRRLRPEAGNRRAFDRDPNRFSYDVVSDLTTIRDSFDHLLLAFGWRASEPDVAPHSPAGFVDWPKKNADRSDLEMILKAAARLKKIAETPHQTTIIEANEVPPALPVAILPPQQAAPQQTQSVAERLDAIKERMKKLMELVEQANAPGDFGNSPGEKARRAATMEGQEILSRHRGKFRFGAVGRDAVKAIQNGEGIYGLKTRLEQNDACEIRLIGEEVGLRQTGKETGDSLAAWADLGHAMMFRTPLASMKADGEIVRGPSCLYFDEKELAAWMGRSGRILTAFGDFTEKAGRMPKPVAPPIDLIEIPKLDADLETRLDSLTKFSQIGAAMIGRFVNTMQRYSDLRDEAIAIRDRMDSANLSAEWLYLIEKAIDDALRAWDEFHASIMPLIQFAESKNVPTPALVKLHQVTDGTGAPVIEAIGDDIDRIMLKIESSADSKPFISNEKTVPEEDFDSFPPGEFVDRTTGEHFNFGGRKLLLDLWKVLWESSRKLEYRDLCDGRIERWKDSVNTEGAIKTAVSDLRQYFRKHKRKDFANAIEHSNKIVWLEKSSLKKNHI